MHAYKSALEVLQELVLPLCGFGWNSGHQEVPSVFTVCVSLKMSVCLCVCLFAALCQACALPLNHISITQLFVWCVYVGKYHCTCWRSKLWVSGIKLKLAILGKPLWLLSHCSSNSPSLKKSVVLSHKAAQADLNLNCASLAAWVIGIQVLSPGLI